MAQQVHRLSKDYEISIRSARVVYIIAAFRTLLKKFKPIGTVSKTVELVCIPARQSFYTQLLTITMIVSGKEKYFKLTPESDKTIIATVYGKCFRFQCDNIIYKIQQR